MQFGFMGTITTITVRLVLAGGKAYHQKWSFTALSVFLFLVATSILGRFDLLPNPLFVNEAIGSDYANAQKQSSLFATSTFSQEGSSITAQPERIEIPTIKLSVIVNNPTTINTEVLDEALLKGAVRYPTSALLGESGNVVIFGHSSYLPIVGNQAYKTFDGIQKLVSGDLIRIYSSSGDLFVYKVRSVTKESAASDTKIPLNVSGRVLTLSTCDSFGTKTDRFVVVADYVD